MTVDMTKWQDMARANAHIRPAGSGRMAGKICIVTGAAQGFGRGIAQELYNEGASIVIADLNEPLAGQVAAEMDKTVNNQHKNRCIQKHKYTKKPESLS